MYFMNKTFWSDLAERAVSTAAQAALGVVSAGAFGLIDISSWEAVGVAAGSAAVIAVLKAFGAARTDEPTVTEEPEEVQDYEEMDTEPESVEDEA